jgi:hypothetical protein
MRESHIEGVATHDDPESCVVHHEVRGEALTGACAGTAWSREIKHFRVPTLLSERKATRREPLTRGTRRPCAVEDPLHVQNLSAREQGDPTSTRSGWCGGSHREGRRP